MTMVEDYKRVFDAKMNEIEAALPQEQNHPAMLLFLHQFFVKTPLSDLEKIDAVLAAKIVVSAYGFLQERDTSKPKIRLFTVGEYAVAKNTHRVVVELLNTDMAFLVDSLTTELNRQGYNIYSTIHPMLFVKRDAAGKLIAVIDDAEAAGQAGVTKESFIHFEISPLPEGTSAEQLKGDLEHILRNIELTVQDWKPMLTKLTSVKDNFAHAMAKYDADEIREVMQFVDWLADRNFVFLGYREHQVVEEDGHQRFEVVEGSPLGIFKGEGGAVKHRGHASLNVEECGFFKASSLVEVTKSDHRSIVHRPVPMDYIGFKRFDAQGNVIGEARFLGLFTSVVYYQSADHIPFIRRKISHTLQAANFDPSSYNGKTLRAILEFFPRDELFQISEDDLYVWSQGILSLESQPDVRIFLRRDPYERFVSTLIYAPRDRFSTYVRQQIEKLMETALNGKVSGFNTQISDAPLARLHLIIKTKPGPVPQINVRIVEDAIRRLTSFWNDALREQLLEFSGDKQGEQDFRVYKDAFPKNYCNMYGAREAAEDIEKIKLLESGIDPVMRLSNNEVAGAGRLRLKLFTTQQNTALSDMFPILENMGCRVLEVHPFDITPDWSRDEAVVLREFALSATQESPVPLSDVIEHFEQTLLDVITGRSENDHYNALVVSAGLSARQVVLMRAYGKYIKQVGIAYQERYIAQALCNHPMIVEKLVAMFETRFTPGNVAEREAQVQAIRQEIDGALSLVSNLAEDKILRRFADTILATLRTNYYQLDEAGQHKSYVSFKLDSKLVPELPLPKPHAEIFVYSTRTEGIHLRGGKVARGGLRWSDRHEDFRTEVLGLVKAQMVKNAVIVPVGSKGGFIVKQPPAEGGRDAFMAEGIACYKQYLMGLLDITDNIREGLVVPPQNVVRVDGDDPYLVVAADKGTATFSDIANSVSESYGFWLGDAFASGGSAGYDHKKMGITAKGGWVCVQRHFREMGRDTQTEDFTCVGIGDMSGDVFGNGMLLSEHIRLVAAFNHMHIFLDPNPNAAASFAERTRLFELPRSQWTDYDAKLISAGGGIFPRSAKSIALTPEVQQMLDCEAAELTPDELIRAILKAPVDLLWNGGIGTYVKSASETNEDVGDKNNDGLRINGEDLRALVVGEGGNLGFTQRGRIEYARRGGRMNTDSIDNSAGVDCSDHEVNIKIAFSAAMQSGKLTREARDVILAEMTENVAQLVLRDNRLQTQAVTITQHQGSLLLEQQEQMMQALEKEGRLNRGVERLPTEKNIASLRAEKKGLSRPELSILLSYAKMSVYDELLASNLPDNAYFTADLFRYFPDAMQKDFAQEITDHRLRREIIATSVTNSIINRAGLTFFHSIAADTGRKGADIAMAYAIVRDAFGLRQDWRAIEALDGKIAATAQVELFVAINRFLERATVWFLRNGGSTLDIEANLKAYSAGIEEFASVLPSIASPAVLESLTQATQDFIALGAPETLAKRVAMLDALSAACDVVQVASAARSSVEEVGKLYYEMGEMLSLGWLRQNLGQLNVDSHWDRLAVQNMLGEIYDEQRRLATTVLEARTSERNAAQAVAHWQEVHAEAIARYQQLLVALQASEQRGVSMFFVALRQLRSIG
jgi:glutamate dehydrogenase